ncbi:MAG: cytochrome c3 family protein, partial [Deltaproteobacteria bacterium]|nr:cytochrome c3 family protein [Deltaproteobacteria bacterium]
DITCVDCHKGYTSEHEQGKKFASRMEYTRINYEICKKCHFSTYTKTLEGVHYHLMEQGNQNVPLCVDCHGYHYVLKPAKPRSKISAACGKCHSAIYEIYRNSIHGNALYEESNVDVPVCTDCHKSHGIEDPRTMKFHLRSPEICAKCHSNEEMMGKYGISTDVMDTYLRDFHGTTASLYQKEGNSDISFIAVCSDCHGIHDIKKVDDTHSSVYEANLLNVCKKCHEKATTNFTAAWLSHYEPSPSKAPLVYYVKLFYRIFIPFVILGLLIHVFLHLYRRMVKR